MISRNATLWSDTHNMRYYAALVLLVKKKDSNWRFSINYRLQETKLGHDKNKFPLPIVDELLDELTGVALFSMLDL
jgi:hypothetical protein